MNKIVRTILSVSTYSIRTVIGAESFFSGGIKQFHHLGRINIENQYCSSFLKRSDLTQNQCPAPSNRMSHVKCRAEFYECGKDKVARAPVSDD